MSYWPTHPIGAHIRTCQECGHTQVSKDPSTIKGENWRAAKCRKCKSEALDYGRTNMVEDDDLE